MPDKESHQANESNKAAWDTLYAATGESIWGQTPLPFLQEIDGIIREKISSSSTILDAATGEGRNLPYLLTLSDKVSACDASSHALGKLSPEFKKQIDVHQCDLAETPFDSQQFDLILMADVIETLPNIKETLLEMHRILAPGGYLIGNIPGKSDGIAEESMTPIGDESFLYQNNYFYRFYEHDDATDLVKACQFSIAHSKEYSWEEAAHPKFREHAHEHCSLVIIAQKQWIPQKLESCKHTKLI